MSYPADQPLAAEFEQQMWDFVKDHKGEQEYLSVHHPEDDPAARDDAPDACAFALFAAGNVFVGQIILL